MATQKFKIDASSRSDRGKGASRRLRRDNKVPAIVYGAGKPAEALTLEHKTISKSLENEAFYSNILALTTATSSERVILKAVQRHPYRPIIMHVDFQRIRADEKLHMNIPLHFSGESVAPGVKMDTGVISHLISEVEVSCLPDDLPEFIAVDLSQMQLNDIVHLSDLKLPKGVELVALSHNDDKAVASLHMPRMEKEETEEAPSAAEVPTIEQSNETAEAPKDSKGEKGEK